MTKIINEIKNLLINCVTDNQVNPVKYQIELDRILTGGSGRDIDPETEELVLGIINHLKEVLIGGNNG